MLCRSTGEPVGELASARERVLTYQLNGVHTASVMIPLGDPAAVEVKPGLSRLKVWRTPSPAQRKADPGAASELVFYGSLPAQNLVMRAAAETIEMTFADPRWVLAYSFTAYEYGDSQADDGLYIQSIIGDLGGARYFGGVLISGDTWIKPGPNVVATGVSHSQATSAGVNAADRINELVRLLDGPDWDIDPVDGWALPPTTKLVNQDGYYIVVPVDRSRWMAYIRVYGRQGKSRPDAVFSYGTAVGSNVRDMTLTYREVVTAATVTASPADGSPPVKAEYARNTETYGVLATSRSLPDTATAEYAGFVARGQVEALKVPRQVITIAQPTSEAPRPHEHYRLGDTIYASCRKGAMVFTNAALRVHAIQIALDQEGNEQVTLTTQESF